MTNTAIRLSNIYKQYRTLAHQSGIKAWLKNIYKPSYVYHEVLSDISLSIEHGEAVGLIGPNGAGKSSLIKILCGIQQPTKGNVEVLGLRPAIHNSELLKKLGVIFGHKTSLWWDLPVIDSFDAYQKIYCIPEAVYKRNLQDLVTTLNLSDVITRTARHLSLGERVKCELAIVFMHDPRLVFLDEPTVGLDIESKQDIRRYINKKREQKNTTILITSHDYGDIETCCDRIIVMERGAISLLALTKDLISSRSNQATIKVTPRSTTFTNQDALAISNIVEKFSTIKIVEDDHWRKLLLCDTAFAGQAFQQLSEVDSLTVSTSTMTLEQKMLYNFIQ